MGLGDAARELRRALAGFDPALVSGETAAALAEDLARTAKACEAAAVRAAARASECQGHKFRGYADARDWMARISGSSSGRARRALELAATLESCPATTAALASGELSIDQAGEITRTEASCPGTEAELVDLARRSSLGALVDEGRRRRLAALDPDDLHRRQHRSRSLRTWRDELGMVRLVGALAPDVGIAVVNRLERETDRIRRAARRDRDDSPRSAHAADALVKLMSGQGTAGGTDLVVVCDLGAWRRGHAHPGEACHVIGGGPVPVATAKVLGADAFLKAVIHDGVKVDTVAHIGRHIPAELRTALDLGVPPHFEGRRCVEEGCGRRYGLEYDHVNPLANGGQTCLANLAARCWPHHRAKTDRDRAAGRLTGEGRAPP